MRLIMSTEGNRDNCFSEPRTVTAAASGQMAQLYSSLGTEIGRSQTKILKSMSAVVEMSFLM